MKLWHCKYHGWQEHSIEHDSHGHSHHCPVWENDSLHGSVCNQEMTDCIDTQDLQSPEAVAKARKAFLESKHVQNEYHPIWKAIGAAMETIGLASKTS